jgi:hypothetical protein
MLGHLVGAQVKHTAQQAIHREHPRMQRSPDGVFEETQRRKGTCRALRTEQAMVERAAASREVSLNI